MADGLNALWYLAEGNYAEAAISGICAIPAVGLVANLFGASPSVIRGIRIAGNVGKIYLGGSAGKQNLDNIHKMVVSGNGQWYDYLREGGMLTLNMLSCAMGTSGVMDDVNDIVKQYQKARTQKLADYVSQNTVIGDGFDNKTFNTDDIVSGSGSKTISYTDYDNIYQSSIHNAGKDKVMLGKYDGGGPTSYITKAGDDYTYFSLGNDWNTIKAKYGYTDNDMFKLFNEAFLDDGINAGKTFQFSHNPIKDTGTLGQEYQYLLKNNYKWDGGTMTMKPQY
ncbi:MAG: hypothetical protein ACI4AQ_06925 [Lachnospiraceae bacterium]